MRISVVLECGECKNRNYKSTKNKNTHPDRLEQKKYCSHCKKRTIHRETK